MTDKMTVDHEKRGKELKRELEGWREEVLTLHSVLVWEQQWHPWLLIGLSTTVFSFLWYLDMSVLSTIAVACIIIIVLDYLGPLARMSICPREGWTGAKERQLEDICRALASMEYQILSCWKSRQSIKATWPHLYLGVELFVLAFLAYVGYSFNNMFLSYLLVTAVLLFPGVKQSGFIYKVIADVKATFSRTLKVKKN